MHNLFDPELVIAEIEAAAGLIKTDGLPAQQNVFDPGEHNGRFVGDLPGGATISGQGSVVVDGSIGGSKSNPCRILVKGDLVVTGDIEHAHIRCRQFFCNGNLQHTQIKTQNDAIIGGQVTDSELVLGDYLECKHQIENLLHTTNQIQDKSETLKRRIRQEERRVDRSCKATRTPISLNVKQLIYQEHGRVRIDLSTFYKSVGDMPMAKLKIILVEFFSKGIVGILARANRRYIKGNPIREKVFLQLLKTLRELFVLVAEHDMVILDLEKIKNNIAAEVEELRTRSSNLHLQEGLSNETQIVFPQPRIQTPSDGTIDFVDQSASVKFCQSNPDEVRLELTNVDNEKTSEDVPIDQLHTITFSARAGHVIWEPINTPTTP